jgi:hypothetical protein
MDDLTRYKIAALGCALVVFAYVLSNVVECLREWQAQRATHKHARTSGSRTSRSAQTATPRAIEPERVARVGIPARKEAA